MLRSPSCPIPVMALDFIKNSVDDLNFVLIAIK